MQSFRITNLLAGIAMLAICSKATAQSTATVYGPGRHLEGRILGSDVLQVTHGPALGSGVPCLLAIGDQRLNIPLPWGNRLLNNAVLIMPFQAGVGGYTTWNWVLPSGPFEAYLQAGELITATVLDTSNGLHVVRR